MSEKIYNFILPLNLNSEEFETISISQEIITKMETLANMYEDVIDDDTSSPMTFPYNNITSKVFKEIIEYYQHYLDNGPEPEGKNLTNWDRQFLDNIRVVNIESETIQPILSFIEAADFLGCVRLVNMGCKYVAENIKDKTPEELRQFFNIENDFTPEEEKEIEKELSI